MGDAMQPHDVYEWLVRRGADDLQAPRVLDAVRTAAGVVPLGGRAPPASASAALIATRAAPDASPESVFFDVLLTCVELPAASPRTAQRAALETYLTTHGKQLGVHVPTSSDDSAAWWRALARARAAYFSARRAFFLARIALLRVALFEPQHPHVSVAQDVARQLDKDSTVDALLEEIAGRDKIAVPAFYAHLDADLPLEAESHLRAAQHLWEQQLLNEDELLRELLLLALQFSRDRVPLARCTETIEHVLRWPAVVVPELFSQHSLAVPVFQRKLRRVAALGSMATLQLLRRASQAPMDNEWPAAEQWTRDFILREAWRVQVDDHHVELCDELTESGVVLVAWAALLAKQYRRALAGQSRVDAAPLEREAQTVLKASEVALGFHQVRDVLRRLVFDNSSPSQFSFLKSTQGTFGATSWDLPAHTKSVDERKLAAQHDDKVRVAIFQVIGAAFVDDSLSALGYVEHIEPETLNAMVKLIRPILANSSVTEALLKDEPVGDAPAEFGSALTTLEEESRAAWPENLLPGLRVLTAMCAAAKPSSTPSVHAARTPAVQLALKELAKKRKTNGTSAANASNPWRQLPPDEFLDFIPEQELVVCKKAFTYADDDNLLVTEGTKGVIDQDDQGHDLVQWELKPEYHNAWETLLATLETLVDQIQTQPLIAIDSPELETFTAFLELIVQSSNGADSSVVLTQVMQQWAHARLKQWWQEMALPNGASRSEEDGGIPALLIRNKVSLRVLQSASREDLVAWGVHDRFMREQILARIAFPEGASSAAAHKQRRAASRDELEKDGLSHLLRMLLGFLDGFVNEHSVMTDDDEMLEWSPKQLHFVTAILAVLAKLTSSLDICIDVLIHELGGGTEECVQLILKSTRKLFEHHESTAGSYTGLFASLTVLMNISRWCVAREAIGVSAGALSNQLYRGAEAEFRAAERHWLVATVEFIMEIVSTHETWRFVAIRDKWALLDRCYRIFTALLTPSYQNASTGVLREFQDALRHTIISDKPLLMKVLRSATRLVAKDDVSGTANDARAFALAPKFENPAEESCLYPFTFEREVGNGTAGLLAREALVASSLRLLDLVMEQSGASPDVANVLLMPIDGDGIPDRTALNLVTLSSGYLAYPLSKNSEIVLNSVRTVRRAIEATSTTSADAADMEQRSLVTLFRENSDLEFIRDTLLGLVRSPGATGMLLRKEVLDLLTTCLDNQPGFFAVLVLDEDDEGSDKTKRLVAMVERFLDASDKLVEGHTDVLCSILRFLRHIWLGGVKERRKLHLQIASALRKSSRFWKNLTQVLRIRLPLSMDMDDDEWAMSLNQEDDHITDVKSIGRVGVFAALARGMILEIVSCEWHFFCSDSDKTNDHPLVAVLDSFREEGLYAHWLRTFTRLDYNASRFAEVADSVKGYVLPLPQSAITGTDNGESVLSYHESVIAGLVTLRWQLEPAMKRDGESLMMTWKRTKWSALVSAHAAAQIHALGQWKVFMELYSLQPGASVSSSETDDSSSVAATTSEHRKRKESMIATPPRTGRPNAPVSPLHQSATSSYFSGDRTSYGIVQVLSETVLFQLQRHERDQEGGAPSFDVLSLSHLKHLVELLVAMLHHQIRVVVRKTRDPKLSSTRARDTTSGRALRLTVARSIELLALVERAAREVFESNMKSVRAAAHSITVSDSSASAKQASLWEHLVGASYGQEVETLALELRSSLLTAALLLTRHITTQFAAQDGALEHELVQRAVVVQVKLTQHAIESIKLCDRATAENKGSETSRLFQVSWSLLHALLDDFTSLTVAHEKQKFKLDAIIALGPLVALLQHETNGLRALFEIVTNRFQPTKSTVTQTQQAQACAVLRGINAVVWNPKNAELCRHVMLGEDPVNGFSVLRYFAKKLVPSLTECIVADQTISGYRGYRKTADASVERSSAHLAWCSVLMIASGLVRQLSTSSDKSVWEFVASAETLLAAALSTKPRLNRAVVEEQACALTFLNALSTSRPRRKQWREMLPKNHVVLMEQSRLALRRACVLLGNSSYTATRKREQQHQAQLLKKPRRLSVTAWPLSSSPRSLAAAASASLTFAHQTLLHEQLVVATASERRQVTVFYTEMESKLTHVVEQGSHLLLKWTAGVSSRAATVSVQGTRFVDDEQLIPLLALIVPSESLTLSCDPSLGHLCIAMEFCVEQLKKLTEKNDTEATHAAVSVAVDALQTSALLFLKTYLLHADQQASDSDQETSSDFAAFFEQLIDELTESSQVAARVDVAFLQQILKVVQLKPQ